MKIKKLLLSFLTLLAIPCILTSCSSSSQNSNSGTTQTSTVKSEDIDYEDTIFMNTIYDEDAGGVFENYEHDFIIEKESYRLSCTACYQAEGGKEYAELYCDWSIERLLSLDLEENYETVIDNALSEIKEQNCQAVFAAIAPTDRDKYLINKNEIL